MTQDVAGVDSMPPWADFYLDKAVGGSHAQDDLNGMAIVKPAVAAQNERAPSATLHAVKDRLNEVLKIVRLLECLYSLSQP